MIVNFLSNPTFSWRNPTSFNPFKSTHWVSLCGGDCHHVWRWSHLRPNNEVFVFAFRMKVFKWSWFYWFWLGGQKLLVHCPFGFIGLFWSKQMSGCEFNERITLVFSQVITSPTLQWHISSKFASSSHDPQFIGAHHVYGACHTYHCNGLIIPKWSHLHPIIEVLVFRIAYERFQVIL